MLSKSQRDALYATLDALSPDEVVRRRKEAVDALRDDGDTLQEIADRLGVTKAAVWNWVKRGSN